MSFVKLFILSSIVVAFSFDSYAIPKDSVIKKILIQRSLKSYPGNCPCPYFTDRAGCRCGKRSAYSKPRGYEPLCYESDVPSSAVKKYKNNLKK